MTPYADYQFRVIVIGDSMVGKSSFLKTFVEGSFSNVCDPTVGVDFYSRTVRMSNTDKYVKLQLWDTAGQEKFRSISRSYYRNCVGVFIIFDITDRETYEHVPGWYVEACNSIRCQTPVFVLVGNKADMSDKREVSKHEAESLAQRLGHHTYVETSSMKGTNVEKAFEILADAIYSNVLSGAYENMLTNNDWDGIKVVQNRALAASIARQSAILADQPVQRSNGCC